MVKEAFLIECVYIGKEEGIQAVWMYYACLMMFQCLINTGTPGNLTDISFRVMFLVISNYPISPCFTYVKQFKAV